MWETLFPLLPDIFYRAMVFRFGCYSLLLVVSAIVVRLPMVCVAADAVIDQPNQYLSPSVKQPAGEEMFDDYDWRENTLTGDWGGWRTNLAEHGLVFQIGYTPVLMQNTHGGFDTGFVGSGPLGIIATLDTERFCDLEGGTLFVDWEFSSWYNGPYPPRDAFDPTGSYVGVNTNFMESNVAELNQIAQLFYEQSWADDFYTVAFGKMDANVRFASVQAAGAFQNSIAMFTSTLNGFIPTYPNEATALVAQVGDEDRLVGKVGWFDGTTAAFDPVTGETGPETGPRGPSTFFNNDGHWWLVAQVDSAWKVSDTLPGTLGVGAWLQTGRVDVDGTNTDGVEDVPGWYLQWQQLVWSPDTDTAEDGGGLAYFGQFGWSDPNKNPVHWSLMTGVSATGVFASRPADAVGIMFAYTDFTNDTGVYQSTLRSGAAGPSGGHELSLETFYLWQWTSWSYLQPGLMWINSPGGGKPAALADALLAYIVVGIQF